MEDAADAEESESGSQVIALDTEGEGDEAATMVGRRAARWPPCSTKTSAEPTWAWRRACWAAAADVEARPTLMALGDQFASRRGPARSPLHHLEHRRPGRLLARC